MGRDTTTINVWLNDYPFPGFLDPAREAARTFNEAHPGFEVVIQGHDFRTSPSKVVQAVEEGNPPDVVEYLYTCSRIALDTLGSDGAPLFTPVGRAIGGRTEILGDPVLLDDIEPAARNYFVYDGEQWAMPPTASTVVMYANVGLLRAAGIEEIPQTWSEVEAACRAVTALPDGPTYGITWPNHMWIFLQAVSQQGGLIANRDNGRSGRAEKIDLTGPELHAWVSWWQRLHRAGLFSYSGRRSDWKHCFDVFTRGEAAFLLSSSVDAARVMKAGQDNGRQIRTAQFPRNEEAAFAGNMIGGDGLWLRDGLAPDTMDGALTFMQHMVRPTKAVAWHKQNNRLPITRTALAQLDEEGWFDDNPDLRVASGQLGQADGSPASLGPVIGDFAGVQRELTEAMHDVLVEGDDPAVRFATANAAAQVLLDAYNSDCLGPPRRTPTNHRVAW